ncbi:MAG: aromatic amino acid ammonia-lyase [Pseudomonadota bacterium]
MLKLDGSKIGLQTFWHAANSIQKLEIASATARKITVARETVDKLVQGDEPVYGLNTGLGANLGYRLKPDEIPEFQMQILRGRAVACGEPLSEKVGRGALLARIISAAQGFSGISQGMFQHLCHVYESGLAPVIPQYGSIGAGDLTQNAHMALAVMGEGQFWKDGQQIDAQTALFESCIRVPEIQPKDAMVLINHSGLSAARSAIALHDAETALNMMKSATVLSFEGYGANREVLAEELNTLRAASGQAECAAWFREMLEGAEDSPRRIQEALSFRTVASVFGAAEAAMKQAVAVCEDELNGSSDSPVVLGKDQMLSTANFHSPALALALENVCVANAMVANGSVQRMQKMMNPDLSGLPRYLSPVGEGSAGMVPSQKTAGALLSEIRHGALPVAFDAAPVSDAVEDVAPMTSQAAAKLETQSKPMKLLAGLEALIACQALDLRRPEKCGKLVQELWPEIRKTVPMLEEDRSLGNDIKMAAASLERIAEERL